MQNTAGYSRCHKFDELCHMLGDRAVVDFAQGLSLALVGLRIKSSGPTKATQG